MSRLIGKSLISALLAGLFCSPLALAQRDFSNVEIIPHQITDSLYYLEGAGGNIGLSIGEDGIVMIDDQFAPLTDRYPLP